MSATGGRPSFPLGAHEAHLWWCAPEALGEDALRACAAIATADEQAAGARFRFARDRRRHLVTRALVRHALSAHSGLAREAWTFARTGHGRPYVAAPEEGRRLAFNVAHTAGAVMVLVALDREVGVDVEAMRDRPRLLDVAERFFAPAEVAALRALPEEARLPRFFEYWTLKEAYIKARGLGLAIPLDRFAFEVGEGPPRIRIDPRLGDEAETWQFHSFRAAPGCPAAVALRRGDGPPIALCRHDEVTFT